MSLILDALRKSAGDRQRGHAPTLASAVGLTPRRRAWSGRVPVALALLAGTAGAGWWLGFGGDAAPAPERLADGGLADRGDAEASAPPAVDPGAEQALAAAPALADFPPALRPEVLPVDELEPRMGESQARLAGGLIAAGGAAALPLPAGTVYTPEAMVTGTASAPPVEPPAASAPEAAPSSPPMPSPAMPVAAQVPATAPSAPPEATDTLPTVDELDYSVRRELPSLEVSMYVYHADPERRFLIVGGKRYPRVDGSGKRISQIDDKVELVEIRADGAVLEFNGQRFLLPRGR